MVYVLVTVLGHVPASVCVIINDVATSPQLSVAVPPAARKFASVVYAGGIEPVHWKDEPTGQVNTGDCVSSTIIV